MKNIKQQDQKWNSDAFNNKRFIFFDSRRSIDQCPSPKMVKKILTCSQRNYQLRGVFSEIQVENGFSI